jgi:hypothetical protein
MFIALKHLNSRSTRSEMFPVICVPSHLRPPSFASPVICIPRHLHPPSFASPVICVPLHSSGARLRDRTCTLRDAPVSAPEEEDVYSPETLEHRRSTRSEMFSVICVPRHLRPPSFASPMRSSGAQLRYRTCTL